MTTPAEVTQTPANAAQTLVPTPDAHLRHGAAHCTLWWTRTPFEEDHVTGYIGNLSAPSGNVDAMTVLLGNACDRLRAEGATLAVGPVNGSTWDEYRLVTDPAPTPNASPEPRFSGEPPHDPDLRAALDAAGFAPWQTYRSGLVPDLGAMPEPQPLPDDTFTLRTARADDMEGELRHLFPLIHRCFAQNVLFTPITEAEFLALYRRMLPMLDPRLILILERGDKPFGMLLMLPNPDHDRVVLKTLCVDSRHREQGLARHLTRAGYQAARRLGYRSGITALMHDENPSRHVGDTDGRWMRTYALFGRDLE